MHLFKHTHILTALAIFLSSFFILSCNNSTGLSKEEEEAIVRTETTKLAHFDAWRHDSFEFFLRDVHDLLWNFQYEPLHRWDFGDYKAAEADQRLSRCKENAYKIVWETEDDDVFRQSYADYMAKYYNPSKYHYVEDDERMLADIYFAAYEHTSPSLLEIATFIVGKFKVNTPVPQITAIQRIKGNEGPYWEVFYDNGKKYRVGVIQKVDGTYGIDKTPLFRY